MAKRAPIISPELAMQAARAITKFAAAAGELKKSDLAVSMACYAINSSLSNAVAVGDIKQVLEEAGSLIELCLVTEEAVPKGRRHRRRGKKSKK